MVLDLPRVVLDLPLVSSQKNGFLFSALLPLSFFVFFSLSFLPFSFFHSFLFLSLSFFLFLSFLSRRFRKEVGGRGLRQTAPKDSKKWPPRIVFFSSYKRHRKRGAEKRSESMVWKEFPCANPLCPPTPFRNL